MWKGMLELYTRSITITKQNKQKNSTYIQSIFSVVIEVQTYMVDIFLEIYSAWGKWPAWEKLTLTE